MIDLKLINDGDIDYSGGSVQIVEGADEVVQAVKTELKTQAGEFFGDPEMGLDTEFVLGKQYNQQYASASITECIQKDLRVTSVQTVTLTELPNRALNVAASFTVDPTISAVPLEVSLDAG